LFVVLNEEPLVRPVGKEEVDRGDGVEDWQAARVDEGDSHVENHRRLAHFNLKFTAQVGLLILLLTFLSGSLFVRTALPLPTTSFNAIGEYKGDVAHVVDYDGHKHVGHDNSTHTRVPVRAPESFSVGQQEHQSRVQH